MRTDLRIKHSSLGPLHRDKWITNERNKRNTTICPHHSFCATTYDFHENKKPQIQINEEHNQSRILDQYEQQKGDISLAQMTEEALDDWIFQSLNRPLSQFLDPKKKFEFPQQYLEEIKSRYANKRTSKLQMENKEYYFETPQKVQKFIMQNGKNILNPNNLLFEHTKLEPHTIPGVPIGIREELRLQTQKFDTRRKGTYLMLDENYKKYTMEAKYDRKSVVKEVPVFTQTRQTTDETDHLFLQNYNNFSRNLEDDEVEAFFAEKELMEVKGKIEAQQNGTDPLVESILDKSSKINDMQLKMSKQNQQCKMTMDTMTKDFKSFMRNYGSQSVHIEQQIIIPPQIQPRTRTASTAIRKSTYRRSHNISLHSRPPTQDTKDRVERRNVKISVQLKALYDDTPIYNDPKVDDQSRKRKLTGKCSDLVHHLTNKFDKVETKDIKELAPKSVQGNSINIKELIQQLNNDRSVELDLEQEKAEMINHKQTAVEEKPKSTFLLASVNKLDLSEHQDHPLVKKTLALLNQNSEDKIKYKSELISFNAHSQEKTDLFTRNVTKSQHWYNRGVIMLKEDLVVALNCFKQSLILEPLHLNAIKNIAVIYEKIGKLKTSKKWFQLALECSNSSDIKFGYSLCLYKMGLFKQSYDLLDEIQDENSLQIYLQGLCAKRMYDLEKAAQCYKIVQARSTATNYELFVHFMMAIVFSQKRQLEIKFDPLVFCKFHALVTEVIDQDIYEDILSAYWFQQQWIKHDDLLEKMKTLSFFKRFAKSIVRKFLSSMSLKSVTSTQVIFPKFNEVHIVISGNIIVLDHRKQFDRPDIVAFYKQGDILGCPEKDNDLCNISDIWFVTQTPVTYISIEKQIFDQLWEAQNKTSGYTLLTIIQNISIFRGVSALTMHKLVYELLVQIQCKQNTVLFNDASYIERFDYIHLRKQQKDINLFKVKSAFSLFAPQQRLRNLIIKHKTQIDRLKFNRQHIDSFYVILDGACEIENPNGFNGFRLTAQDFFGESLMFKAQSFNAYGRIRVSEQATVLKLSRFDFNKIPTLDLKIMEANCKDRQEIKRIEHIFQRRLQVKEIKNRRLHEVQDK